MKKKIMIGILLIVFSSWVKGQEYKWGLSAGAANIMLTENWKVSRFNPFRQDQYEQKLDYWGYGFYYCGVWQLGTQNEIVIKPGIFISSKTFSGIESGFYYKRIFGDDYKACLGFNVNIHDFNEWANGRPANTTIDVSIERRIVNDIFFGVSFSKPVNENFGGIYQDTINGEIIDFGYAETNVHYMLKAYIEYYW